MVVNLGLIKVVHLLRSRNESVFKYFGAISGV